MIQNAQASGQKEIQQLKTSIGMLRTNIEGSKPRRRKTYRKHWLVEVMNQKSQGNVSGRGNELDRSNAEKDQAVQAEKSNALTEINQLKSSLVMLGQTLRREKLPDEDKTTALSSANTYDPFSEETISQLKGKAWRKNQQKRMMPFSKLFPSPTP